MSINYIENWTKLIFWAALDMKNDNPFLIKIYLSCNMCEFEICINIGQFFAALWT